MDIINYFDNQIRIAALFIVNSIFALMIGVIVFGIPIKLGIFLFKYLTTEKNDNVK